MKLNRQLGRLAGLFATLLFGHPASAQPSIISANNADLAATTYFGSLNGPDCFDNAVMGYNSGASNILAIAFQEQIGTTSPVVVLSEDDGTTWTGHLTLDQGNIGLQNFSRPNVIIGGPYGTHDDEYLVGVVYTAWSGSDNEVYMDTWEVIAPGTSGGFNFLCTNILSDPGTTTGAHSLRADIITKQVSGPSLKADNFVVAWIDASVSIMGGGNGISIGYGALSDVYNSCTLSSYSRVSNANLTGGQPVLEFDIAAFEGNSGDSAIVAFKNSTSNFIYWGRWPAVSSSLAGSPTQISTEGSEVRVDAMDPYEHNSDYPSTFFDVTYLRLVSGNWRIMSYNQLMHIHCNSTLGTISSNYANGLPAITCGPTSDGQYSIGYKIYDPGLNENDVYIQNIWASDGDLFGDGDYYQVDDATAHTGMRVALSNDWYLNPDALPYAVFVSWFDNDDEEIKYKITNANLYPDCKPTQTGAIKLGKRTKVYPNPAMNVLNIADSKRNSCYNITDIMGRNVQTGTIITDGNIDITGLLPGMYFLDIDGKEKVKFTKL